MASAAAVGANAPLSPEPAVRTEPSGTVSSAIIPNDEPIPDTLGEDVDEDDDIAPRGKRRGGNTNGDIEESDAGDADDLFGDAGEEDEDELPPIPYVFGGRLAFGHLANTSAGRRDEI